MYEDILISVIMCVYNTPEAYLLEAVKSILNQTHRNLELLIVDDCSSENLFQNDIFSDPRINIIRLKQNCGPASARNIALKEAFGKYIAIMDSDDISLPERLGKQVSFMETNPAVVACGTWFKYFGQKKHEIKRVLEDNDYYRACLLFGNAPTLLNPSVMLRTSIMRENNLIFDERLRKGEDYKLWVQLTQIGVVTNYKEVLVHYRVHQNQTSNQLRTKNISPYDWIVMKEQFDSMGMVFTPEEEALYRKDFRSPEVDAVKYWKILQKILKANRKSHFFIENKLEQRVQEQWEMKILCTKNPFSLMKIYGELPEERKMIVNSEWERIKRRF